FMRIICFFFFFSSRRRHTRSKRDWSSDVCSSDLPNGAAHALRLARDGPDLVHGIRVRRGAQGPATSDESPRAMIEVDGGHGEGEIGRASCRERGEIGVVAGA